MCSRVVIFLLVSVVGCLPFEDLLKCCDKNYEVSNSTCVRSTKSRRFEVYLPPSPAGYRGECFEVSHNVFYTFKADNGVFTDADYLLPNFVKCCPVGFAYNKTLKACQPSGLSNHLLIRSFLMTIGLERDCKLAIDHTYRTFEDFDVDYRRFWKTEKICSDRSVDGDYIIRRCQKDLEVCREKRCLKKCCPYGQSFVGGARCHDTWTHGIETKDQYFSSYIDDIEDDFEIIYGTKCPRISVIRYNNFQYQITKNGSFRYFYNYTKEFVEQDVLNFKSYCIEHVQKGNMQGYFLFDCYEAEVKEKYTYTMGFKILSAVFLLLTMIIYVYTGETKNIFGKILISYCVSILFLMITLLVAHVNLNQTLLECKIRGYFITWLTLCSFTWLNIMSVNIWSTFSQPQGTIGHSQKKRDIKKFMLYSIYGWGVPVLIVFIIFVLEFTKCLPEPIHPYVGIFYCMFEKLIFQFINTVVFFKTIIYCIRVKNEINKLNEVKTKDNHKFAATKEKLGLIIKLATVMGVIYIFEVATGFFNDIEKYGKIAEILEIILYSILSSQGIFIFAIFICKKKTVEKLKKKLHIQQRKTSQSMSSTQTSFQLLNKRQPTKISLNETIESKA